MPRPSKSRADRTIDIAAAIGTLQTCYDRAIAIERAHGASDPRALAAWESVEVNGATVHRQSRILAGKSRGG